eukprot:5464268-Heterocapsa_arctica.AAC.1
MPKKERPTPSLESRTRKIISIRWVKAHLNQEKVTAAGVSYEDWYGNDQAGEQAKAGAENHGYTKGHNFAIKQKEDAEKHNNIKGTKTGAVGRPFFMPEQLGHD